MGFPIIPPKQTVKAPVKKAPARTAVPKHITELRKQYPMGVGSLGRLTIDPTRPSLERAGINELNTDIQGDIYTDVARRQKGSMFLPPDKLMGPARLKFDNAIRKRVNAGVPTLERTPPEIGLGDNKPNWRDVAPFVSNLINSFRRPPGGQLSPGVSTVPSQRVQASIQPIVNMWQQQRAAYDRNLDENTAAIVSNNLYTKAQDAIGDLGLKTAQLNAQLGDAGAQRAMIAGIHNSRQQQEFLDNLANREMIDISMDSANVANAADKYIMLRNRDVDTMNEKTRLDMLRLSDPWGTQRRFFPQVQSLYGQTYGQKLGGPLRKKLYRLGGPVVPKFDKGGPLPGNKNVRPFGGEPLLDVNQFTPKTQKIYPKEINVIDEVSATEKDWMTNWYSSRGAQRRMQDYYNLSPAEAFKALSTVRNNVKNTAITYATAEPSGQSPVSVKDWFKFANDYSKDRPTLQGFYNPPRHGIYITKDAIYNNNLSSTIIHELSHATGIDDQTGGPTKDVELQWAGEDILKAHPVFTPYGRVIKPLADKVRKDMNMSDSYIDYLKYDNENYPRIMKLRYEEKLNPNQSYTPTDVQKMRTRRKDELFDAYSDEEISGMLNSFVKNKSTSSQSKAKLGGKLNKYTRPWQ